MSDYKQEMSFEERCRQPLDAALRVQRRMKKLQPDLTEALVRFQEHCQKIKQKMLAKGKEADIIPMLKEDR